MFATFILSQMNLRGDDKIVRVPKFTPDDINIEFKNGRGRGGRYANYDKEIRYIADVVGSKRKKDITRNNSFLSKKAFVAWNVKHGGKYVMVDEKIDGDDIPELVVKNPKGKLVAVNGYTVKRSDWGVRKPFYEAYPTPDLQ